MERGEHIAEEVLELYAAEPGRVAARTAVEAHLAECARCTAALMQVREFAALLEQSETWMAAGSDPDELARAEELRAFAARMAAEEREAEELLAPYEVAPPSRFVWDDLPGRPEWRTGGVVRRLCTWANQTCERNPLFALTIAETATAIAHLLLDGDFPRGTVHQLRGDVWKEQANALRYLGRFPEALGALDRAEGEYNKLPVAGIGPVAVLYIRATILYEQEHLDTAERLASDSARQATHLGDRDRAMRARHLQGEIRAERGDTAAAARCFQDVYDYGEQTADPLWLARESLALGLCAITMNDLDLARRQLQRALTGFTTLKFAPEVTRTQWALARLMFAAGHDNAVHAVARLRQCIDEFTRAGMLTDAALTAIDLAEVLDASGRAAEIPRMLTGVVATFTRAGKLTSALTALAYLQSAAASGKLAPQVVTHVRRFVARADRRPELAFAPPL